MKKQDHIIRRYALFCVGLFIASMGVALSAKAGLGTSPVASVPYSVSLIAPQVSFGDWLNVLSVLQIGVQILLLRRKCDPVQIVIQTILAFAYGYLTNFSCSLISGFTVTTYAGQLAVMALSCIVLGFGLWVQFMGNVAMLPGEAMNRAIAEITGKKYENVKIVFDVAYIAVSALLCLVFIGRLEGVREGSVVAALAIGNIIRLYNKAYRKLTKKD